MRFLPFAILVHQHLGPSSSSTTTFTAVKAFTAAATPSSSRLYHSTTTTTATILSMSSTKRVLVPIAEGSEEIETTCITDTLTRFGANVTIASVMPDLVCKMSRGIKVRRA
jgi:hypothetical protein